MQAMGEKRSWVQERMSGARECKATDIGKFALYFGVPAGQFFEDGSPFKTRGSSTRRNRNGRGRIAPGNTRPGGATRPALEGLRAAS